MEKILAPVSIPPMLTGTIPNAPDCLAHIEAACGEVEEKINPPFCLPMGRGVLPSKASIAWVLEARGEGSAKSLVAPLMMRDCPAGLHPASIICPSPWGGGALTTRRARVMLVVRFGNGKFSEIHNARRFVVSSAGAINLGRLVVE